MILSLKGTLSIAAAFVNIVTLATLLDLDISTTKSFAQHPIVKILFLYFFAFSVIPDKLACLFAVALFSIAEIKNFVTDESIIDISEELVEDIVENAEEMFDDDESDDE